jgi:hypothetical protein
MKKCGKLCKFFEELAIIKDQQQEGLNTLMDICGQSVHKWMSQM